MGLDNTTEWSLTCYELLAGGMVIVAVAYIVWFFYDHIVNGPEPPGPWGFR